MQIVLLLWPKTDKTYQKIYFDKATIIVLNAPNVHISNSVEYIYGWRWFPSVQLTDLAHAFCISMEL